MKEAWVQKLLDVKEEHNLSDTKLGDYLEVSRSTVHRWKKGECKPCGRLLELALDSLGSSSGKAKLKRWVDSFPGDYRE